MIKYGLSCNTPDELCNRCFVQFLKLIFLNENFKTSIVFYESRFKMTKFFPHVEALITLCVAMNEFGNNSKLIKL